MFYRQIFWLCLIWLFPLNASGTIVEAMDVEVMAQRSTEVVKGSVVSQEVVREGARIQTQVTVRVERGWKGRVGQGTSIVLVVPGGQIGNLAQTAAGIPEFQEGEQLVLFLWRPSDATGNSFRILGLSQGHFRVKEQGNQWMAMSDRRGLTRVVKKTGSQEEGSQLLIPLLELESRLEKVLNRKPGAGVQGR